MPINWYITVLDEESDGIITNTITIPLEGALVGMDIVNTGSLVEVSSQWDVIPEASSGLPFEMGESLKVIMINWRWPYNRHDAKMYYNQSVATEGESKTLTYDEYIDNFGVDGEMNEPTFTYEVGGNTVSKKYSELQFNDYVDLHNYCSISFKNGSGGYQQIYEYLNYTEYVKWQNNLKVPDSYLADSGLDIHERQTLYLDEIDTEFSKMKVDIQFLLSFKVEQAMPTTTSSGE